MFLTIICLVLQFVLNVEQGLPLLLDWLSFTRVNARARKGVQIGPTRLNLRYEVHVFNPLLLEGRINQCIVVHPLY
jgi:hypothetical protein